MKENAGPEDGPEGKVDMENFNLDDINEVSQESQGTQDPNLNKELGLTFQAGSSQSIEDIYDRHTKKIFVVDVSGSMSDPLYDLSAVSSFRWDRLPASAIDDRIARALDRMAKAAEALAYGGGDEDEDEDFDEDVPDMEFGQDNPMNDPVWAEMINLLPEERKALIISTDCWNELMLELNPRDRPASKEKIEVVRQLARRMVEERLQKYEDADISLITFGETADHTQALSKEALIAQIEALSAWQGSTYIVKAVQKAISLCKKAPSPVQSHHIILVTDGLGHDSSRMNALIPELKRLGIILDVIHIASWDSGRYGSEDTETYLRETCAATGGAFNQVRRLSDFEQKYLQAGRRLCLPAPSGAN